jgi:hypothetical protein
MAHEHTLRGRGNLTGIEPVLPVSVPVAGSVPWKNVGLSSINAQWRGMERYGTCHPTGPHLSNGSGCEYSD